MIFITGDTHQNYRRFTKKKLGKLPFVMTEEDF